MRELRWRHGRAWITTSRDQTHPALDRCFKREEPLSEMSHRTLTAGVDAAAVTVGVLFKCQVSSFGDHFAQLGGVMEPHDKPQLSIRVRMFEPHPDGRIAQRQLVPRTLDAIQVGLESLTDRPCGALDVSCTFIHYVDYWVHVWTGAAAALGRLACADVASMSDDEAARLACSFGPFAASS